MAARLAEAEQRAAELGAFTASLGSALARLDAMPDRAGRCDPECGLTGEAGAERWRTAPVACSLDGDGLAERTAAWAAALDGAGPRTALPGGLRLTLPADRTAAVAALAADEQRCCPFFDFRLHLDGPALHLDVRAPAEGAELLHALFGRPD